ncbi:hypothetical protein NKG94_19315 [Micromonospora sp. M12]
MYREAPNASARTMCSDHLSLTASSATARESRSGLVFKPSVLRFVWLDIQTTLPEEAPMTSPSDPRTDAASPVVTQRRAWTTLVITGLIIGTAFIALYVGLQRSPQPTQLPIAVVGEQLATTAQAGFGNAVSVTEVASVVDGEALVRHGDAIAVLDSTSPPR